MVQLVRSWLILMVHRVRCQKGIDALQRKQDIELPLWLSGIPHAGMDPYNIPRSKILGSDSYGNFRATLSGALDLWGIIERSH